MIVVVASAYDVRASRIVAHWTNQCAAMLTADDLCLPGWNFAIPHAPSATAVIGGKKIPTGEITGILTLRPCVYPEELENVRAVHRKYVAAELNAFLMAWLNSQACPVMNRPGSCCLAGPNWRPEQWTQAAAKLGLQAKTRRCVPHQCAPAVESGVEALVVSGRCFGDAGGAVNRHAVRLAEAAGVELLSARFSADGSRFLSANVWPPLVDDDVLAAVRDRLEGCL